MRGPIWKSYSAVKSLLSENDYCIIMRVRDPHGIEYVLEKTATGVVHVFPVGADPNVLKWYDISEKELSSYQFEVWP